MGVYFKDIIGQKGVVGQLRRSVDENRLAHALLLAGPRGNGKLAIAVALANYLLCNNRSGDVCGNCPACTKLDKFIHSDFTQNSQGLRWQHLLSQQCALWYWTRHRI